MMRWALVVMVLGLTAGGLAYDRFNEVPPVESVVETERALISSSMADPPRLDVAWYCPVGSSSEGGYANHVVNISNLADEPAVANLSIITDAEPGPRRRIELPPLSTQRVELSTIQVADVAGAVVEVIGGRGAVGHTVTTASGSAEGPCATQASNTWHFAAGRTSDAKEYLVLMNPFPETAVFDVEFQALGRSRTPGPLQGAFVRARSVRIIDVSEFVATSEETLAAWITTARGRLVVERLQVLEGERGPAGAALQLGVPAPSPSWMFTAGRVQADGDDLLTIYNPFDPTLVTDGSGDEQGGEEEAGEQGTGDQETESDLESTTEAGADGETPGAAVPDAPAVTELLDEEGTVNVLIDLWPSNPTDLSTYGVNTIRREVRPGTFVTIDLRAQAELFEFPLPYELGVFVSSEEGLPLVAERWQFAERVVGDLTSPVLEAPEPDGDGESEDAADPSADEPDPDADGAEPDPDEGSESTEEAPEAFIPEIRPPEPVSDLPQPLATAGVSTTRGTELFSTRWVIPWVTMIDDSTLVAVAAADQEASVEVRVLANGEWLGPFRATVPRFGRAIIPVTSPLDGAAIEVESDHPVSVEAMVVVPDVSLDVYPAIPTVEGSERG